MFLGICVKARLCFGCVFQGSTASMSDFYPSPYPVFHPSPPFTGMSIPASVGLVNKTVLQDTLWGPKASHSRVMFQAYADTGAVEPAACTLQQGWQGLADMSSLGLRTCP